MVRERATPCSSSSSGYDRSSTSTTSSSSSSFSSGSSSRSGNNARSSRYKRCRRKSLSSKSRSSSNRELSRKHKGKEHASYEKGKNRRKLHFDMESNGKLDKRGQKRRLKKRKLDKEIKDAKKVSSLKTYKSREFQNDFTANERSNNLLEVAMNAQEQQKALIRQNAELAKARLESGELQRARDEQRKMHQLYGTVDWRANKKLRTEKKILERTVAAGRKLASLEQREYARMDAFRVALGLPTAEAQRQAEWRREATQALAELENGSKPAAPASSNTCRKPKQGLIGPMLPP